jgi:hypothetical protein
VSETFHLGDLLSLSTGRLVAPGGFSHVHRLVEFLAGGPVWTHQLPAATDALLPGLISQHHWLVEIAAPETFDDEAHVWRWLDEQIAQYGEHHEVTTLEAGWSRDPVADLTAMVGRDRVIPVIVGDEP